MRISVEDDAGNRVKWKFMIRVADPKYLGEKAKKKKKKNIVKFNYSI